MLLTVALLARDLGDDVVVFRFWLFQGWMGLFWQQTEVIGFVPIVFFFCSGGV
jgi:hypothetical protein